MENITQNIEQLSSQPDTMQVSSDNIGDIMQVFEVNDNQQVEADSQSDITAEAQSQDVEIDEKFKHLDPYEARIRTLQSRHDRVYNEYQKLLKEQEENAKYLEIFNDLLEDDMVFEAFVRERKPELIKDSDVTELIQKRLKEEFGDVRYTRAEADNEPGGKAWLYFKRLDELYNEYKGNSPKITSLREAIRLKREQAERQQKEAAARIQAEMEEVKRQLKWNDQQLIQFSQWANKVKLIDIAKMYNYAIRALKIPSVANVNTGNPITQSLRSKFLNNL